MPWRTVCEVVERGHQKGHEFSLLSLGGTSGVINGRGIPSNTLSVRKSSRSLESDLREVIARKQCDVIIWPVVWREPYWRIKIIGRLDVPLIGYLPGGVYRLADAWYAARRVGLRGALPYLADAIWPKRLQLKRWRNHGFRHLITMTSYTARAAVMAGWPDQQVSVIPPGRDVLQNRTNEEPLSGSFEEWREGHPFFLFAGPPSGIRGIYELLEAFDWLASNHENVRLVCLFRSDAPLEADRIKAVIGNMTNQERVFCIWESLSRAHLEAFMANCHAIVLPFVAVPSEIPLAIIEAMQYGRPVITTMTGGTGDFVMNFGESVPLGNTKALADSMLRLLTDENYHEKRCKATLEAYGKHPTWDVMTEQWIGCIHYAAGPDIGIN